MAEPAIKGSGFESAVGDLQRLLEEGRLDREELEARLEKRDLALLEEKVLPSLWYPLSSYERMCAVLLDVEGHGDVEYLVERGRRAADRLYRAGLYRQLDATVERWGERLGPLLSSLGEAMFRDTRWTVEVAPGGEHFHVEVTVPPRFPECARHSSTGFMEFLGSHAAGFPAVVRSSRPAPDRMVFEGRRR